MMMMVMGLYLNTVYLHSVKTAFQKSYVMHITKCLFTKYSETFTELYKYETLQ